jgi:choline dehydrogenase-like flavoprotein
VNVAPATIVGNVQCDVCIVGSGAAGMTLACELDGSGLDVVLLEAGGDRYEFAKQQELRGEVADDSPHPPVDMYRRRMLGGATTIWGGRCVPMSPIDLEYRDYVPHSGWPITWNELEQYYPVAQKYCCASRYVYDLSALENAAPTIQGLDDPDLNILTIEQFSQPVNFGRAYLPQIARSSNVRIILRTKALRLQETGSAITSLDAVSDKHKIIILARHYVLAMGGLETPRLLMLSDDTRRGGIGNEHGLLGRFYMCHAENLIGRLRLRPDRPAVIDFERMADGVYIRRKLCLSDAAQRRERVLNTVARFHYPLISDPSHRNGILSAMYLAKDAAVPEYRRKFATYDLANTTPDRDIGFWLAHARNIIFNAPQVTRFGCTWMRRRVLAERKLPFVIYHSRSGEYPLDMNAEQIPDRTNAVSLSDKTDTDGQAQIRVNWRLSDRDIDSFCRTVRVMRDAFARTGCCELVVDDDTLEDRIRLSTPTGGHHIGTARMSDNPSSGVVDRHCTVHGLANLHLAGAAVFPTCGHANPTLTIVALAARLAGRLKHLGRQ